MTTGHLLLLAAFPILLFLMSLRFREEEKEIEQMNQKLLELKERPERLRAERELDEYLKAHLN